VRSLFSDPILFLSGERALYFLRARSLGLPLSPSLVLSFSRPNLVPEDPLCRPPETLSFCQCHSLPFPGALAFSDEHRSPPDDSFSRRGVGFFRISFDPAIAVYVEGSLSLEVHRFLT